LRAALLKAVKTPLSIEGLPQPQLSAGEVLIKVMASGVCHTDLHVMEGDLPPKKLPIVLGHEVVGFIEETGPNTLSLRVGDLVGVYYYYYTCGECEECLRGQESNCSRALRTGIDVDGGYAEYIKAKASHVIPIPNGLKPELAAPLLCSGATAYNAVKDTSARPGDWVAIYGVGGIGHLAIQYAKLMGFNVVAISHSDEKLAIAQQLGADETINAASVKPEEYIKRKIGGVHAAICSSTAKEAYRQAFFSVKRGGTLVAVGSVYGELTIPIIGIVRTRITIKGSGVGSRSELRDALSFSVGRIKPDIQTYPLNAINDIFEKMREGKLLSKAVLIP
jgi:propanol-preferring alcohol dehydrogenase